MGKSEDVLKDLILSKYKSIRDFTTQANMPYTTVDSVLKRGVLKSNVDTVIKICQFLGISADALINGQIKSVSQSNETNPTPVDLYTDVSYSMMNTLLARNGKKLTKDEKMALITILSSPDEPEDHDSKKQDRMPDLRKTKDGYVMGTKRVDEK